LNFGYVVREFRCTLWFESVNLRVEKEALRFDRGDNAGNDNVRIKQQARLLEPIGSDGYHGLLLTDTLTRQVFGYGLE